MNCRSLLAERKSSAFPSVLTITLRLCRRFRSRPAAEPQKLFIALRKSTAFPLGEKKGPILGPVFDLSLAFAVKLYKFLSSLISKDMAANLVQITRRGFGETMRTGAWWLPSLLTFLGFGAFIVY